MSMVSRINLSNTSNFSYHIKNCRSVKRGMPDLCLWLLPIFCIDFTSFRKKKLRRVGLSIFLPRSLAMPAQKKNSNPGTDKKQWWNLIVSQDFSNFFSWAIYGSYSAKAKDSSRVVFAVSVENCVKNNWWQAIEVLKNNSHPRR